MQTVFDGLIRFCYAFQSEISQETKRYTYRKETSIYSNYPSPAPKTIRLLNPQAALPACCCAPVGESILFSATTVSTCSASIFLSIPVPMSTLSSTIGHQLDQSLDELCPNSPWIFVVVNFLAGTLFANRISKSANEKPEVSGKRKNDQARQQRFVPNQKNLRGELFAFRQGGPARDLPAFCAPIPCVHIYHSHVELLSYNRRDKIYRSTEDDGSTSQS